MRVNISSINAHSGLVANVANNLTITDDKGIFVIKAPLQSNNHAVTAFTTLAKHSFSMHKQIPDLVVAQKYAKANVEAIKATKSVPNGI